MSVPAALAVVAIPVLFVAGAITTAVVLAALAAARLTAARARRDPPSDGARGGRGTIELPRSAYRRLDASTGARQ
jgi:hypothetical protein